MKHALPVALLALMTVPAWAADDAQPSKLPFLADEARARGYELPLPFGASLVMIGLGGRKIEVTDVRLGEPGTSVSQFLDLGSESNVFNANLKFDTWLLPFLNVYGLIGYVHNDSKSHAHVTVPQPGGGTAEFDTDINTSLDGVVGGLGLTLAAGYREFFMVADGNYVRSDLGFDDDFTALIATLRAGWQGRAGKMPLQLWAGVGNWDTAATAKATVDLPGGGSVAFQADQRPETKWMYDVGTNLEISKHWQLVIDVGADFNGGALFVVAPTYRF